MTSVKLNSVFRLLTVLESATYKGCTVDVFDSGPVFIY